MSQIRRRDVLRASLLAGGLAAIGPVLDLAGAASAEATTAPGSIGPHDVLLGLSSASGGLSGVDALRGAWQALDWSWLRHGDTVLVKPAANSGYPHPSTTSPDAVRAVVAELYARGAGQVIVGEQSGVEHVRHRADGSRFSSTRAQMASNGLLAAITASGARGIFFDDLSYTGDWFEATPPAGSSWGRPLMLPKVIEQADHIITLPRIAAHAIAGYTAAHKIAIGWLREDSRAHLHTRASMFYENVADIGYVPQLRERFRFALGYADKFLLHFGPDEYNGGLRGTVVAADPRVIIASSDQVAYDAVSSGLLSALNKSVPLGPGVFFPYSPLTADLSNHAFFSVVVPAGTGMPWGNELYAGMQADDYAAGVTHDKLLIRGWNVTGGRSAPFRVVRQGAALRADLRAGLLEHGEGFLTLA